ncbi:MAG: DeoR/GlpR family DNA-binding transcription regulator [Ruminococcus sp.]|nr:DeoR/GlpR family DNA-binding transcription regulator [Ruminococcus sp.]MCD7728254.1 DeoR/GlpR family DNA-binding transcription regulator [Ruminococcus sp.]
MLAQERYARILDILKTKSPVTVTELTRALDTSESTIRRDLISLDEMGKLKKVHGGALAIESAFNISEDDVLTRSKLNVEEKMAIGEYAATLIKNDDFVFIDAGTTTECLIDYIASNSRATFVTNGIVHARKLVQKGLKAYVVAGQLKLATEAIVGAEGVLSMEKYNFSKCFMGSNGVSIKEGYSTPDAEEALIKRQAMNRSYMRYILADNSKFGKIHPVTFAAIEAACIITDRCDDDRYKDVTVVKEVLI